MSERKIIKLDHGRKNVNARFFEEGLPSQAVLMSFVDFNKLIKKAINGSGLDPKAAKDIAYKEQESGSLISFTFPSHALFREKVWGILEGKRQLLRTSLLQQQETTSVRHGVSISDAIEEWCKQGKAQGFKEQTRVTRYVSMKRMMRALGIKFDVIKNDHGIETGINTKVCCSSLSANLDVDLLESLRENYSTGTVKMTHKYTHQFLEYIRSEKYTDKVFKKLKVKNAKALSRALEPEEVNRVLTYLKTADPVEICPNRISTRRNLLRAVMMFRYTGLRRSELNNLRLQDIYVDGRPRFSDPHVLVGAVQKTKIGDRSDQRQTENHSGVVRSIGNPELLAFLRDDLKHRSQNEVFYLDSGYGAQCWQVNSMTISMRKLLRKCGIEGVQPCHCWRHTVGIELIEADASLPVVQHFLGHKSPVTTASRYLNTDRLQRKLADAAALLGK